MANSIDDMRARHKQEIEELQDNCKHVVVSGWLPYHWAPGHFSHDVKTCRGCGKIVESNNMEVVFKCK